MHVLSAHWGFFPLCTHRHCCCCLMLQFSSVPMLFCFTPTWIKYTHHISSQNPHSRISVSLWAPVPRLLDFPSKQFKHSLFSGARPEYRLEEIQANRGLHTFLHNSLPSRESGLVEGARFKGDIWQGVPAPAPGLNCFLSLFKKKETSVFLLSPIHRLWNKYYPGSQSISSPDYNFSGYTYSMFSLLY